MPGIEFTFFAVGRVAPAILTLVIAAYLLLRRRPDPPAAWLGIYFLLLGVFNLAYLAAYSVADLRAAYAWIPACAISFAAVARVQFAYVFPAPRSGAHSGAVLLKMNRERRIVLALTLAGAIFALVDYIVRSGTDFVPLFHQHAFGSRYSSPFVPAVSALCYFWSIVVGLRFARRVGSKDAVAFRASLQLAGITVLELAVSGLNLFSMASMLEKATVATLSNVTVLFILSAYVVVFMSAARKRTGFMHRLVGVALVTILGLLALTSLGLRGPAYEQIRGETRARTELVRAEREVAGAVLVPRDTLNDLPPRLRVIQDGLIFFQYDGGFHYASAEPALDRNTNTNTNTNSSIVAFAYSEFRERIDASAGPIAFMMFAAALLVLFVFPLLFRASLVAPLQALAADLGHIYRNRKDDFDSGPRSESTADAPDEIGALRLAFQQMTELLEEARAGMPEYATHLERVHQVATGEARRIPVGSGELVFRSASMQLVVEAVERLRSFRHPVLITGETGTGKEMIARLLHAGPDELELDAAQGDADSGGARQAGDEAAARGKATANAHVPFIAVNCAALPEALWESEIFGHRKGAFTDARADRAGRIQEAGHGTLFFDEIGEMPLNIQAKMLRLLQEMDYVPLGADRPVRARCRFVFATHRDLEAMAAAGEFRQDLLYRIQVFQVPLAPLRERPEDIPELAEYLERFAAQHPTSVAEIDAQTHALLARYPWPGNIRELENTLLRAVAFASGERLLPEHFAKLLSADSRAAQVQVAAGAGASAPENASASAGASIPFDEQVRRYSRQLIERALDLADGNKSEAARILGLKRTTLRNRMRDLGITDA